MLPGPLDPGDPDLIDYVKSRLGNEQVIILSDRKKITLLIIIRL